MMRISGLGKSKINVAGQWHKTAEDPRQSQWDQDHSHIMSTYPGLMDRIMQVQQESSQEQTELGSPPPGQIRHAISEAISREFPQAMQDPVVLRVLGTFYEDDGSPEPMPKPMSDNDFGPPRASDHQPGMIEPGHNAYRGDARRAAIQTGQQLMALLENGPENVLNATWRAFQQKMEQVLEGFEDPNVDPWGMK